MYAGFFKRFFDIFFSLLALPFLFLLTVFVAPVIFLYDRGSVFYRAKRRGRGGRVFYMLKFRSMQMNAPEIRSADGSVYTGERDARVTPFGRIMRKLSVDELPQILNVLKGDMSFIGPRPHLATAEYSSLDEKRKKRLRVRPGITGYSQAYFRNSVGAEQKIENDCFYVDNLSFALDLKILFRTVYSVLARKNIYASSDGAEKQERGKSEEGKRLLIVGASLLQLPAVKKAREMGLAVAVADYDSDAVAIPYADKYYNVSTVDEEGIYGAAKDFGADGIFTAATDMPMRAIAYACERLGLCGISRECAEKATDKGKMRDAFAEFGVAQPRYRVFESAEEALFATDETVLPCVCKPADNSGSRGVMLASSREELRAAILYGNENGRSGRIIIEEYLTGREVSVEALISGGETVFAAVTDKITSGAPYFVELGHTRPTSLSEELEKEVLSLAEKMIRAVGIENGSAHAEIIVTENGVAKAVEIGARMGGDYITSHLVPLSSGVDMIGEGIKIALGQQISKPSQLSRGAAIRYLLFEGEGVFNGVKGIGQARLVPGVRELEITMPVGKTVGRLENSADRLGFVIAEGESAEDAANSCEKAIEFIKT